MESSNKKSFFGYQYLIEAKTRIYVFFQQKFSLPPRHPSQQWRGKLLGKISSILILILSQVFMLKFGSQSPFGPKMFKNSIDQKCLESSEMD